MPTSAPHLGRVFVSSVFGGMMNLRALAGDVAHRLGLTADLTEQYIPNLGHGGQPGCRGRHFGS